MAAERVLVSPLRYSESALYDTGIEILGCEVKASLHLAYYTSVFGPGLSYEIVVNDSPSLRFASIDPEFLPLYSVTWKSSPEYHRHPFFMTNSVKELESRVSALLFMAAIVENP